MNLFWMQIFIQLHHCTIRNRIVAGSLRSGGYALVITWHRVQYSKYFPSFSNFAIYFKGFQAREVTQEYEKKGKYLPILHEAKVR